jgi:hypothetical protein
VLKDPVGVPLGVQAGAQAGKDAIFPVSHAQVSFGPGE